MSTFPYKTANTVQKHALKKKKKKMHNDFNATEDRVIGSLTDPDCFVKEEYMEIVFDMKQAHT